MIKKIVFCLIAAALIFAVTACGEITLPDYNFSDDGKAEANLYFTALNSNDYEGSITWKFIYVNGAEEEETSIVTIKTMASGAEKMVYMRQVEGTSDIATINNLTDNYYIDNVAKTVTTEEGDIAGEFFGVALMTEIYGKVDFQDESETRWDFVSKKNATVKNSEGVDTETVEFEYTLVSTTATPLPENESGTLRLNFRKNFPIVERMQFETADDRTITVYITELGGQVSESDFVVPGEAEGYTDITEVV